MKKYLKSFFTLDSVQNKILMITKVLGIAIFLLYMFITESSLLSHTQITLWFIVLVGIIFILDYFLYKTITLPLKQIKFIAQQIADLNFSESCAISSNDEFGFISDSLNTMCINLKKALTDLELANQKLNHDIEDERQLAKEKKTFIDNISHELKTPLGIIQAYAEGLKDNIDISKKDKYCNIILEQTTRINNLVISLLNLSTLEDCNHQLHYEKFEFIEFVETIAGRMIMDLPNPQFLFKYILPDQKVYVYLDRKYTRLLLENLISNAINYVNENGLIKMEILIIEKKISFTLFNECLPLSNEQSLKIWEKFYTVSQPDKPKSSGLGLSIVASISHLQNITYASHNHKNGIDFQLYIPIHSF